MLNANPIVVRVPRTPQDLAARAPKRSAPAAVAQHLLGPAAGAIVSSEAARGFGGQGSPSFLASFGTHLNATRYKRFSFGFIRA